MPHFEIHVSDTADARAFYSGLFGWTFEVMPTGDDMEYYLISGPEIEAGLTGGLMPRTGPAPEAGTPVRGCTLIFTVTDCDERYAWALANGGAEALPPTDYPGIGRAAYVEDGQGNIVGFITPQTGGE